MMNTAVRNLSGGFGPRRGMTLVESVVVLIVACIGVTLFAACNARSRQSEVQLSEDEQFQEMGRSLQVWSRNHNGSFPVPSVFDAQNKTTSEIGAAKDHSANMWSILVFNGFVNFDYLISPNETNPKIAAFQGYSFNRPANTNDPDFALWDPNLSVDFVNGQGHVSYATIPLTQGRRAFWRSDGSATQVILGNRGPEHTASGSGPPTANQSSGTLARWSPSAKVEGQFMFADLHVEKHRVFDNGLPGSDGTPRMQYRDGAGKVRIDNPFFDEQDDPARSNTLIGMFTTAGEKDSDFTAIWD